MKRLWWLLIGVAVVVAAGPGEAQEQEKYKLLATNRTGTMQDELNEAGAAGYRFAGTQGGETAFGGREAVVVMMLDPEGRRFRYVLLATSRTGTLQQELNDVPPEFDLVGMTVFLVHLRRQGGGGDLGSGGQRVAHTVAATGRGRAEPLEDDTRDDCPDQTALDGSRSESPWSRAGRANSGAP